MPAAAALRGIAVLALNLHTCRALHLSWAAHQGSRPLLAPCVRGHWPTACSDGAADTAAEKRLRAERLALLAERAALEAEQLSLEAEKLRVASDLRNGVAEEKKAEQEKAVAATPAPFEAPPPPELESSSPVPAPMPFNLSSLMAEGEFNESSFVESAPSVTALRQSLERMTEAEQELQLSAAQVEAVRSEVFGIDSFYVMGVEQSVVGTIFRGNLRAEADQVFERVQSKLSESGALQGVRLLLINDPIPLTLQQMQDGEDQRPVFLAIGPATTSIRQTLRDYLIALTALAFTGLTTLGYALSAYLLSDGGALISKLEAGDVDTLARAVPIAAGLGGLQLAHEVAHFVQARRLGMSVGVPTFIPSLQLGGFGAFTRLLDFSPSRTALFDFALSGPATAAALSLMLYLLGLALSPGMAAAAPTAEAALLNPVLPVGFLQSSLLLGYLAELLVPGMSSAAPSALVELHPLAVVGFTGVLVNALQLLPVGRLDGGRVSAAVLGSSSVLVSGLTLLFLGLSTLFYGDNPVILFFGLLVVFFQRAADLPATNELSGVDSNRQILAAAAASFTLLTLIPMQASTEAASQVLF